MAKKGTRLKMDERKAYEHSSGLEVLRQYIPDSDYNDALIEHVSKCLPPVAADADRPQVREKMLEKATAILSYLRDNGHSFSIEPDRNEGQLKAKVDDMEIRLLDKDENSQFVGRVYKDRVVYRFSFGKNSQNKVETGEKLVTPEMAVDLVRYAMGESVKRKSLLPQDNRPDFDEKVGEYDDNGSDIASAYRLSGSFSALYVKGSPSNSIRMYCDIDATSRSNRVSFYGDTALEDAEAFIETSRANAVATFTDNLKLEAVDTLAKMKANGEFEGLPEFSDSKLVADMQKEYYTRRLSIYSDTKMSDAEKTDAMVLQESELKTNIDALFGNATLRSLNAVNVAAFMDQGTGFLNNERDLTTALKLIQKQGVPYSIDGEGFETDSFKNGLIAYDDKPVYDNDGHQIYPMDINPNSNDKLSPFWKTIGKTVYDTMNETGVRVEAITVDRNGVIHYDGNRATSAKGATERIYGDIGQVFEPISNEYNKDGSPNLKYGLIETKFNSGENYYIAPGYTAYIVPPTDSNDTRSYVERTRLRSYERQLSDEIRKTLRHNIIAGRGFDKASELNNVYHHIQGEKRSLNFEEEMIQEGKDIEMIKALTDTAVRRVRYDNIYKDETSILAKMNAEKIEMKPTRGYNMYLDNVRSNMAIMDPNVAEGIFDIVNTGTGTNQGIVRYLTADAVVNEDGSISRGFDTRCPITAHEDFKYLMFNPPDRGIMSLMNAMNQSSTARGRDKNLNDEPISQIGVGTAHMSLGGYTQDDAFVVSKEFADANLIRGADGKMRPLKIHDKICDHSGNKGVISFIADRNADMSYYEPAEITKDMSRQEANEIRKANATKAAQKRVIDVFRDNPTLDVVGAPYTAPSRFNGGTAREMIASQEAAKKAGMPTTLYIDGEAHDGCIGYVNWIITDMPVDEKTHLYEADGDGGRKASGQLVWGLAEMGAKELIDEIYRYNPEPTVKVRELALVTGVDLTETAEFRLGYQPHMTGLDENGQPVYEQRKEFSVREITDANRDEKGVIHGKTAKGKFNELMANDGGIMCLPFPLEFATGQMTPEKVDEAGKGTGEYMLPVMAAKYRSNRETIDGKLLTHEYSSQYKQIYDAACDYMIAKEKYDTLVENGEADKLTRENKSAGQIATDKMRTSIEAAQRAYNQLADSVIDRYFSGKHNIFKDEVMRKQLQGTATAVISPDPSLDLDEVGMTATMALSLGLNVDDPEHRYDPIVDWRDPLLSGGGIRPFKARIIENRPDHPGYDVRNPLNDQIGISINPSSATSFEGDFDGDSMGLYVPQTAAGRRCAKTKLSYPSQFLNREAGERGHHAAYFQDGLDVAAGLYYDELAGGNVRARMDEAVAIANKVDTDGVDRDAGISNEIAFAKFNRAMHDAQNAAFGHDIICYASAEEHIKSLIPMVKSGAKGSPKKLVEGYAPYFGAKFEIDENYELQNFEDVGVPYVTTEQRQASFAATHAKAYLTGVAGKFSQHAQMMALNVSKDADVFSYSAAATALTHPVTQSVMQLKHDGTKEILHKIDMIQTVAPALWAGQRIQRQGDTWCVAVDGKGNTEQVSPDEWKKMFRDFYEDKNGLNVGTPNPDYIAQMADIMTVQTNAGPRIVGFDTKTKALMPTERPLTRLAYECSFDTIKTYAETSTPMTEKSLFSGSVSGVIAPKLVRENLIEQEKARANEGYVPVYHAITAKDTQYGSKAPVPSVDAIDNYIREHHNAPVMEISSDKSYAEMTNDEKINVMRSLTHKAAEKIYEGKNPELTPAESEAYNLCREQKNIYMSLGDRTAVGKYLAEHPDAFKEQALYQNMLGEEKKRFEKARDIREAYDNMSVAERTDVIQSIARKTVKKLYEHSDETLTDIENEMSRRYKEQRDLYSKLGTDEAVREYEAKNPDAFREYKTYQSMLANEKRGYLKPLDLLSTEDYDKVAKNVTEKYMQSKRGQMPQFTDTNEIEFNNRLLEQGKRLDKIDSGDRKAFVAEHVSEFRERIICSKIRVELEAEQAANKNTHTRLHETATSAEIADAEKAKMPVVRDTGLSVNG